MDGNDEAERTPAAPGYSTILLLAIPAIITEAAVPVAMLVDTALLGNSNSNSTINTETVAAFASVNSAATFLTGCFNCVVSVTMASVGAAVGVFNSITKFLRNFNGWLMITMLIMMMMMTTMTMTMRMMRTRKMMMMMMVMMTMMTMMMTMLMTMMMMLTQW